MSDTSNRKKCFFINDLSESMQFIEQMLLGFEGLALHKEGHPTLRKGMTRAKIDEDSGYIDIHVIYDAGRPYVIEVSTWRKNRASVRALPHGGFGINALRHAIRRVITRARLLRAKELAEVAEFVAERTERDRKDAVIRDAGLGTTSDYLEGPGIKAEWTNQHGLTITGNVERMVEIAKMLGLHVSE